MKNKIQKDLGENRTKKSDSITMTEEKAYVFLHESEVDFDCCSYIECIMFQKIEQAEILMFIDHLIWSIIIVAEDLDQDEYKKMTKGDLDERYKGAFRKF